MLKDSKLLILPTPPLFSSRSGNPLELPDETYPAKSRGMTGFLRGKFNPVILWGPPRAGRKLEIGG